MLRDLRYAFRQLFRSPGFAAAVVVTLALVIGVNTAAFSVLDGFLLRRLPYPQPDRMAALVLHYRSASPHAGQPASGDQFDMDGATWEALQERVDAAWLASWGGTSGINLSAGSGAGHAVRYVHETRVSAGYFRVLGIPLLLGREFNAAEDSPAGPEAVVLGYGLWRSTFGGSHAILGQTVKLKGAPYTVVGVLGANAATPGDADLFTPLRPARTGECGGTNCDIILRLKPGARWPQLAAELGRMPRPDWAAAEPKITLTYEAMPLQRYLGGAMTGRAEALMIAVTLILLIACANLAGLALVRLERRVPEVATRLALGATRAAILRQLWVENLVLALAGAGAGLALGWVVLGAMASRLDPAMIPVGGFSFDGRVLGFTLAAALATSALFGALPALAVRRVDLRTSMSGTARGATAAHARLRQALIGAEVALAVVLLAGAGLLVRTLVHLETLPAGFDPHNVMTATASLADARYEQPAAFEALIARSVAAMQRIPGVEAAATGLSVPYQPPLNDAIRIADGPHAGTDTACSLVWISPGYLAALRIPLLAGREFTASDSPTAQPVAIVNLDFGRRFYGGSIPLGRHFTEGNITYTIVGVAGDVLDQSNVTRVAPLADEPVFYVPYTQVSAGFLKMASLWMQPAWMVRTAGPIAGIAGDMQRALGEVDPDLPFAGFHSMLQVRGEELRIQRIEVTLLAVLAGLALLLAALGVYGLVSNLVVQRRTEIGIRLALGSSVGRAMLQVGGSGVVAAALGTAAGLGGACVALRALASEVYGVGTYDPLTLGGVCLLLLAIAAVASYLPTLRIAAIDPAETLRAG